MKEQPIVYLFWGHFERVWNVFCSSFSGPAQQQVQDEYVQGLTAAGRMSERGQLHLCSHAGGAGEVRTHTLFHTHTHNHDDHISQSKEHLPAFPRLPFLILIQAHPHDSSNTTARFTEHWHDCGRIRHHLISSPPLSLSHVLSTSFCLSQAQNEE